MVGLVVLPGVHGDDVDDEDDDDVCCNQNEAAFSPIKTQSRQLMAVVWGAVGARVRVCRAAPCTAARGARRQTG